MSNTQPARWQPWLPCSVNLVTFGHSLSFFLLLADFLFFSGGFCLGTDKSALHYRHVAPLLFKLPFVHLLIRAVTFELNVYEKFKQSAERLSKKFFLEKNPQLFTLIVL